MFQEKNSDVRRVVRKCSSSKPVNQSTVMQEYLWILKEILVNITHWSWWYLRSVTVYRHNGRVTTVSWKLR